MIRCNNFIVKIILVSSFIQLSIYQVFSQNSTFAKRKIIDSLNSPWEIIYGSNDSLRVTECNSYLLKKISVKNLGYTTLLDLSKNKNFNPNIGRPLQGGLMGMALHPEIFKLKPDKKKFWVYLAYVYSRDQKTNHVQKRKTTMVHAILK